MPQPPAGPVTPRRRPVGAFLMFVVMSVLAGLLATVGATPVIAGMGIASSSAVAFFRALPDYIEITDLPERNEVLAYRDGKPVRLATVYAQNRQTLGYDEISDHLKNAAVDGEDRRFWEHGGIDTASLGRVAVQMISGRGDDSGGASTLTMQLVRNLRTLASLDLPTAQERTAAYREATARSSSRKLGEMRYAIALERRYSKKEILTAYLNIAYFGSNTYGVEAAAQRYYAKSARDVTPAEAASLLAIVQWPERRHLASPGNYAANQSRRDVLLKSMHGEGHLDDRGLASALASKPADYVSLTELTQGCNAAEGLGSAWFCDYAVRAVKSMPQLGNTQGERDRAWRTGGYTVQTTLDLGANDAQKALIDQYAPKTETRFELGGALDSVEAGTGRILTMAQNKDFNQLPSCLLPDAIPGQCSPETDIGINLSVDQANGGGTGFQTGSTFKIFTLLEWLRQGHSTAESVNGTPHAVSSYKLCAARSPITPLWKAQNDDGRSRGRIPVSTATAFSVNAAYVDMAQELDYCDIRDTAQRFGVELASPRDTNVGYGDRSHEKTTRELLMTPAAILGTNTVAPLTMAAAFAGVAADGKFCAPIAIDNVTDAAGKNLGPQAQRCTQAADPEIARTAVKTLRAVLQYGTAAGGSTRDGQPAFGKTGTTDDKDQIWLIGSSSAVATVAWMGNITGKQSLRTMSSGNGTGYSYAASRTSLWRAAQEIVNRTHPGQSFPEPSRYRAVAPEAAGANSGTP